LISKSTNVISFKILLETWQNGVRRMHFFKALIFDEKDQNIWNRMQKCLTFWTSILIFCKWNFALLKNGLFLKISIFYTDFDIFKFEPIKISLFTHEWDSYFELKTYFFQFFDKFRLLWNAPRTVVVHGSFFENLFSSKNFHRNPKWCSEENCVKSRKFQISAFFGHKI
jgi:hypothetical protein